MKELVIIQKREEKQIAYVEEGIVKEYYKEVEDKQRLEGNIYIGKVEDVLPGMQAAFVNIGEGKNTFLHIRDVLPKRSNVTGNKEEDLEQYNIKDYIKPNDMLLVQVKKDSTKIKGARVSTHIQLPGRFVVLLPENDFITISQKIEEQEERERLLAIAKKEKGKRKIGIIIRTAAKGVDEEKIQKDIQTTIERLEKVQTEVEKQNKSPRIIKKSNTILEKILLDIADQKLERIWVNTKEMQERVAAILKEIHEDLKVNIEYQAQGLENKYDIQTQLEKMENRKIWLKCGGFITIDKTEALTAIDVNSR